MTAEIAILNSNAVALAADSAVTVGRESGKVYASADKLFQLSCNAPVGIMLYGQSTFLGVPWETVIKCYRSESRKEPFPKLAEYLDDFIRYVVKSKQMFPRKHQRDDVRTNIYGFFYGIIRKKFEKAVNRECDKHPKVKIEETQVKRLFADLVKKELQKTKKYPKLQQMSARVIDSIKKEYSRDIAPIRKEVFGNLPMSRSTQQNLKEIVFELLTSERLQERGQSTGLVVAGFGKKEHFPQLVQTELFGMAADHLLYSEIERASIESGGQAVLVPLAQREMVFTFMEGIDPELYSYLEDDTKRACNGIAEIILEDIKKKYPRYGTDLECRVKAKLDKLASDIYNENKKNRTTEYRNQIMEMVASLPKDELGGMAESLVNLTKFKRRISRQQETVGGPIDVAVITKGDGFVWTKRKHYFKPELNPRYINRIARGDTL
jgi:hypothetical protein